jgi:hypothetical protein
MSEESSRTEGVSPALGLRARPEAVCEGQLVPDRADMQGLIL